MVTESSHGGKTNIRCHQNFIFIHVEDLESSSLRSTSSYPECTAILLSQFSLNMEFSLERQLQLVWNIFLCWGI